MKMALREEWEKTFTYTITSKSVRVQQWEVQSCGKQLTESEVKRIAEKEGNRLWNMGENRYGHVGSSVILVTAIYLRTMSRRRCSSSRWRWYSVNNN